jgi:uncharacterized radical SAM superfamily protein
VLSPKQVLQTAYKIRECAEALIDSLKTMANAAEQILPDVIVGVRSDGDSRVVTEPTIGDR